MTNNIEMEKTEMTEAEWAIMEVVWDNAPCAAGTVQEALTESKGWAYSTVKTTMDRMVKKGLLRIEKIRNLQLFSPCISQKQARTGEFRKMLTRAFNGAMTPMMQFLLDNEKLSKSEIVALKKLVEDKLK
ncbi:MAG: BlaI/MecI/CopY family transcriptional regulator [Sedimentisphaerales bacterium]|nr:BlaI/MecI/CopY family transcriptional regulator [Sedimentisphaerales bacterium]MBN2842518.1 BlaI/MecI/CopY family transcriptional regulator [Sedimentisphaerales bacterium]